MDLELDLDGPVSRWSCGSLQGAVGCDGNYTMLLLVFGYVVGVSSIAVLLFNIGKVVLQNSDRDEGLAVDVGMLCFEFCALFLFFWPWVIYMMTVFFKKAPEYASPHVLCEEQFACVKHTTAAGTGRAVRRRWDRGTVGPWDTRQTEPAVGRSGRGGATLGVARHGTGNVRTGPPPHPSAAGAGGGRCWGRYGRVLCVLLLLLNAYHCIGRVCTRTMGEDDTFTLTDCGAANWLVFAVFQPL